MPATAPEDGRAGIDAALVRRLIAAQFPQWADLPVTPVAVDGWDNRTYRLGERMTVRLPTAPGYVAAVAKENHWLPRLAPALPLPVPPVLGRGRPGEGYRYDWSVRGWLDGDVARRERIANLAEFARDVAGFLTALQRADPTDGPAPGPHCFHRGGPVAYYDDGTRRALTALDGVIDTGRARAVWEAALASAWTGTPVWFHGDIAVNNLLVRDGRLAAVIDFGTSGVGDPACDLVLAWTLFEGPSRAAFRTAVAQDAGTWARARGWALWKALITLAADPTDTEQARVITDILADATTDN
ncbi:aminoglycoside phosphotransferase family protein [Streptomyces avicenniae]|uniref:aminoglycoside phosphotransferase family protein n=1 Tax=Streptomyces avicenniae TaxID=500153 RepID=UPI00069AB0BD|nr:aminoglycoside phosphotransferase family protein [Streptomyces avicenniae]